MKKKIYAMGFFGAWVLQVITAHVLMAQTQIGTDIDGIEVGENSGWSISMPTVTCIGIGAPENDINGGNSGQVRIYTYNGAEWVQKGEGINGDAIDDLMGGAVSMPDENTIAVGAPQNDANGSLAGQVYVYSWNGSAWVPKGEAILGDADANYAGFALSMPTAETVAVGAPGNSVNGLSSGQVKVYAWNGSAWIQQGAALLGAGIFQQFGHKVSMPDENTVAVSAIGAASVSGVTYIYQWDGMDWVPKGEPISGEMSGDESGRSLHMPDPTTVAIGAPNNDGGNSNAGHVRVYSYVDGSWVQKGADIDGGAEGELSGTSVAMGDANTLVIGATGAQGIAQFSGFTRVYQWDGSSWQQLGTTIDGEAFNDQNGYAVSMPNATTFATASIQNDGNGNESGHVRVYGTGLPLASTDITKSMGLRVYPNPSAGNFEVVLEQPVRKVHVALYSSDGKLVAEEYHSNVQRVAIRTTLPAGSYLVQLTTAEGLRLARRVSIY